MCVWGVLRMLKYECECKLILTMDSLIKLFSRIPSQCGAAFERGVYEVRTRQAPCMGAPCMGEGWLL